MNIKQSTWKKLLGYQNKEIRKINAEVIRFKEDKEEWIALVGLLRKKPYKFFMGLQKDVSIPNYVQEGVITERMIENTLTSDFNFEDEGYAVTLPEISDSFDNGSCENSQLVSQMLQSGKRFKKVFKSLSHTKFVGESANVWEKNAEMILKDYL